MMKPALLVLAVLIAGQHQLHAQEQMKMPPCLQYQPDSAKLIGHLERITFPGAPNYTSVTAGDAPETGFYLRLSHPICTKARDKFEAKTDVTLVQIMLDTEGYNQLRPGLDKQVTVTGTLMPATGGHANAPVLIMPRLPVQIDTVRKP